MKKENIVQLAREANERKMTYGQYMVYLATHHDEESRKKAPYQQEAFKARA